MKPNKFTHYLVIDNPTGIAQRSDVLGAMNDLIFDNIHHLSQLTANVIMNTLSFTVEITPHNQQDWWAVKLGDIGSFIFKITCNK